MHRFIPLRFWQANRHEFRFSLLIAFLGFVGVLVLFPPPGFSFDGDNSRYVPQNVTIAAGQFVVALASWLCAANAYQDTDETENQRNWILGWWVFLSLWMLLWLLDLTYWWHRLNPLVRPTWLQGF